MGGNHLVWRGKTLRLELCRVVCPQSAKGHYSTPSEAMVHFSHWNSHKSQSQTEHLPSLLKDKFSILGFVVDGFGDVSVQRGTRHNREIFSTMPYSHNLLRIFFKSQACISLHYGKCMPNLRPKTEMLLTVMLSWVLLTYELLVGCPALRAAFLLFFKLHQSVCLKGLRFIFFFVIFSEWKPQEWFSNVSHVCSNCVSLFMLSLAVPLHIRQRGNSTPTLGTSDEQVIWRITPSSNLGKSKEGLGHAAWVYPQICSCYKDSGCYTKTVADSGWTSRHCSKYDMSSFLQQPLSFSPTVGPHPWRVCINPKFAL